LEKHTLPLALIVEETSNPSTQYFVLPALIASGFQIQHYNFSTLPEPDRLRDSIVIFVRYVPGKWARFISSYRDKINRLIFFMDDDVLDCRASVGMPLKYRYKLIKLAALRVNWLKKNQAELWVSTDYLREKYQTWQPKLIPPSPLTSDNYAFKVFYHGSASHRAEIEWLYPVIKEAMSSNPLITFEIIGDAKVSTLFKNLNRVAVIHPMKWTNYLSCIALSPKHLGLAPLLDIPFNRARSYTKFFDIHRCGAVGIFAEGSLSADIVTSNTDGIVLPMKQDAWVNAILAIATDEARRQHMFNNGKAKVEQLKLTAEEHYQSTWQP
jgi:hypothetical protein